MNRSVVRLLDEIVETYQEDKPINNLKACSLPNQSEVIRAFNQLQHLIFLGFFTHESVNKENLRDVLKKHFKEAHDILVEQLTRALTRPDLYSWGGRTSEEVKRIHDKVVTSVESSGVPMDYEDKTCLAQALVQGFLAKIPELRRLLAMDVEVAGLKDPAATSIEEVIFAYPCIIAITAYRIAHALEQLAVPTIIPRIISEYAHSRTGIDIHPSAIIGERFFIDHGTGVVIGATTSIGNDVTLYQGVTLGSINVSVDMAFDHKRHPTIEDGVTIYANATILGGKTVIGANSIIGGNVWLLESVPPNSLVTYIESSYRVKPRKN